MGGLREGGLSGSHTKKNRTEPAVLAQIHWEATGKVSWMHVNEELEELD